MKPGGGHNKGGAFERTIATRLSLWVSGHKRDDLYWRTANSGGRTTLRNKTSTNAVLPHQAGDIGVIHPEGQALLNLFVVECKHWADLDMDLLLWGLQPRIGVAWVKLGKDCTLFNRLPLLIAKQNLKSELVLVSTDGLEVLKYGIEDGALPIHAILPKWRMIVLMLRDVQLLNFDKIRAAVDSGTIQIPPTRKREYLDADDRYSRLASY